MRVEVIPLTKHALDRLAVFEQQKRSVLEISPLYVGSIPIPAFFGHIRIVFSVGWTGIALRRGWHLTCVS